MTVTVDDTEATRITARIVTPLGGELHVITESNYALDHSPTPLLPPVVAAGMRQSWDVEFDGPVDAEALRGATQAQNIFSSWYPRWFHEISVSADPTTKSHASGGVGCFFSGGVDSFYSAITQSDRITHLIFVHGFDIDVNDEDLAERALAGAREAAAELGKPLIEIKTTMRSAFGGPMQLDWAYVFHGPALAHVGLALAPHLGTVIIPSSYSRSQLHPWGSHPDLDPLWSSSGLRIEHHELDVGRFQKMQRISGSETAMNHLRVCWLNTNGSFNCGECAKCIRTKLGLRISGVSSRTLPGSIDLDAVRRMNVNSSERMFLREGLAAMRNTGMRDVPLAKALKKAIRRSYVKRVFPFVR